MVMHQGNAGMDHEYRLPLLGSSLMKTGTPEAVENPRLLLRVRHEEKERKSLNRRVFSYLEFPSH